MNVLKPHLQTTIWTLLKGGATQREIERITGISRHTIRAYQQRFAADPANCPGVATDFPSQTAPPWPPTLAPVAPPVSTSRCEPHRAFIVCVQRTHLDPCSKSQVLSAGVLVFAQLCGSNSPRRLLGQVGSFVSTSLR